MALMRWFNAGVEAEEEVAEATKRAALFLSIVVLFLSNVSLSSISLSNVSLANFSLLLYNKERSSLVTLGLAHAHSPFVGSRSK